MVFYFNCDRQPVNLYPVNLYRPLAGQLSSVSGVQMDQIGSSLIRSAWQSALVIGFWFGDSAGQFNPGHGVLCVAEV